MTELASVEATSADGTPVVRVSGEIDLSNATLVRTAIGAALPETETVVVVDLSGTTYLDSAGIAMLFLLAERLTFNRRELRLVVPPDAPIRRVIALTQLDRVVPVQDCVS